MSRQESREPEIRKDIDEILRQAFPEGIMAVVMDIQESYLADVFPRLKKQLLQVAGTAILHERDPTGGPGWHAGDGRLPPDSPETDPQSQEDRPSSYYLFFVAPTDKTFQLGAEEETCTIGYCVALSVVGPLALIVLTHMERDGITHSVPDIVPEEIENAAGEPVEIADFCRESLPEEGLRALHALRDEITETLASFGVKILPEQEQDKQVPWLKLPPMPFLGSAQRAQLTVRDAFFFWGM